MHLRRVIAALAALATTITPTLAKGINCKGSFRCQSVMEMKAYPDLQNYAKYLANQLIYINDTAHIPNGEKIACSSKPTCAFLQNTENTGYPGGGLTGLEVKRLAWKIVNHGCKRCGSVPVGYPEDNDGRKGQLTFNFVNGGCNGTIGLCSDFEQYWTIPDEYWTWGEAGDPRYRKRPEEDENSYS